MQRPNHSKPSRFARTPLAILAGSIFALGVSTASAEFSLTGASYLELFDGSGTINGVNTLPAGWVFGDSAASYAAGTTASTRGGGTTGSGALTSSSQGGAYVFVNGVMGSGTDRAIGFLTSGSFTNNRNIMFGFTNNSASTITALTLTFDYEKYRSGTATRDWTLYSSTDGAAWGSALLDGGLSYAGDAGNTTILNPPTTTSKSVTISSLNIPVGTSYYFRWNYTGSGTGSNGQGLGLDNVNLTIGGGGGPGGPKDLIWSPATSTAWNTTVGNTDWLDGSTASKFTDGDNVTFDTAGVGNVAVDGGGVNPNNLNFTNTSGVYSVSGGPIGGTGILTKTGAGTVELNTAYANDVTVNGGTLRTLSPNLISNTAAVRVGATGTFALNNVSETIGKFELTGGTISTGSGTLTVNGSSSTFASATTAIISGSIDFGFFNTRTLTVANGTAAIDLQVNANIVGGATLIKAGPGTMALAGTTDLTALTVDEGVVLVNGALTVTDRLIVSGGAQLGGTGTITGNTEIAAQAKLAPGASIGTLTFAGNLDLTGAAGGTLPAFLFELGAIGDKVILSSGILSIGTSTLTFSDFSFQALAGFGPGTYLLFDTSASISGTLGSGLTGSINGLNSTISLTDGGRDILLTVVPEPGSAALLMGGLALLSRGRRRRTA